MIYNIFFKYDQHIGRVQYKTFLPVNNSQLNTPNKTTTFRKDSMDDFLNIANTKFLFMVDICKKMEKIILKEQTYK